MMMMAADDGDDGGGAMLLLTIMLLPETWIVVSVQQESGKRAWMDGDCALHSVQAAGAVRALLFSRLRAGDVAAAGHEKMSYQGLPFLGGGHEQGLIDYS